MTEPNLLQLIQAATLSATSSSSAFGDQIGPSPSCATIATVSPSPLSLQSHSPTDVLSSRGEVVGAQHHTLPDSCDPIERPDSPDNWPFTVRPNEALAERILNDEHEFNRQLYRLMRSINRPIQRVPHLGFKRLNLFEFFRVAASLGGYTWITRNRDWKRVYDSISDDRKSTSAATCTRRHYETLLLPFERYVQRLRGSNEPPIRQVTRLQRGRKPKVLSERSEQIERLMRAELNLLTVDDPLNRIRSQPTDRALSEMHTNTMNKETDAASVDRLSSQSTPQSMLSECKESETDDGWNAGQAFLNSLIQTNQWKSVDEADEPNLLLPRKRGRRPKYIKELQKQLGLNLDMVGLQSGSMRGRVHTIGSSEEVRQRFERSQAAAIYSRTGVTDHAQPCQRTLPQQDGVAPLDTDKSLICIGDEMRKRSRSFGAWSSTTNRSDFDLESSSIDFKSDQLALDLRMKHRTESKVTAATETSKSLISSTQASASDAVHQALNAYLFECYRIALEGNAAS